jgi:hypothetical protein
MSLSDVEVRIGNNVGKVDNEDMLVPKGDNDLDSDVDLGNQVMKLAPKDKGVAGDEVDVSR